jgi:nicotinate-nucleotide pyrophosphorylase (carboxylating)
MTSDFPQFDWEGRRASALLESALLEDRATQDATTLACIDPQQKASAVIAAKQDLVLAGFGGIRRVFEIFSTLEGDFITAPQIEAQGVSDGISLSKGQPIAIIRHNARAILSCERVILNLLQHMCGIATLAREFVNAVAGTSAVILDTRKTIPGLRLLEKYAVRCGGATNHRNDLSDGVLIKNNHIALCGGVQPALEKILRSRPGSLKIEVEVRTLDELDDALRCGAEALLLDNMNVDLMKSAVQRARAHSRHVTLEASGGMNLANIRSYAETGVDFISVGALTHSSRAADINLRIQLS